MLGFELTKWDYITFVVLFIAGIGLLAGLVLLLGLPGRIAAARKHPDAEAVALLGWFGGFALLPWMQALIWAFKPADPIDVRKWPLKAAPAKSQPAGSESHRDHDRPAA